MRLLALAGDIDALIAQIRLVTPLSSLCAQHGHSLQLKSFHDCTRADLAAADLLVVQRAATPRALHLQQRMRARGGAVLYDIDDLLTEVPTHISNQTAVKQRVAMLRQCLSNVDIVGVSTARLGHALGLSAERFVVVPNHAWPLGDAALPSPRSEPGVTLLLASSDQLACEFLLPALRALNGWAGVRIVVVGPPAQALQQAGIAVQPEPLMPRDRFIAFARSLPNVVGVIPLEDSRFAACKSAVKWFDYAEAGIPTLCSNVSPYADVVTDGVDGGLVDNQTEAWGQALQAAIADADWRQRVAMAARLTVRARFSQQHTVAAWQRALDAAMQHRQTCVPPAPGMLWRTRDAMESVFEATLLRLRALNRARLVRRSRR